MHTHTGTRGIPHKSRQVAAEMPGGEAELGKVLIELKEMEETSPDDVLLIDRILNMGWSSPRTVC